VSSVPAQLHVRRAGAVRRATRKTLSSKF
jgi:hypothetical protein